MQCARRLHSRLIQFLAGGPAQIFRSSLRHRHFCAKLRRRFRQIRHSSPFQKKTRKNTGIRIWRQIRRGPAFGPATGYEILEERGLEVYLVNARHTKNLPGRKNRISYFRFR
jgi:hypothetical protein